MQATTTMEPPPPRPRPWQEAAAPPPPPGPMPMPWPALAPALPQHPQHPQQPALATMPPPPPPPQPYAAALGAAGGAGFGPGRVQGGLVLPVYQQRPPLPLPLPSQPQQPQAGPMVQGQSVGAWQIKCERAFRDPLSAPTSDANHRPPIHTPASYYELAPPLRIALGPAPTPVNPNSGLNTPMLAMVAPARPPVIYRSLAPQPPQQQHRPRTIEREDDEESDEGEGEGQGEGRLVRRRRVGPPPVAHGWALAGDRVLRVARAAWEGTMGALLNERRFGWRQAEGFMCVHSCGCRVYTYMHGKKAGPTDGTTSSHTPPNPRPNK